jgi:hypothetical protein
MENKKRIFIISLFIAIWIIVNPGQKGAPDTIVGIVKRSPLENLMKTFKNKFD